MKVLFIGDIVGRPGRVAVERFVPSLREERGIDFVVANCENAAGGAGITPSVADELFRAGVDALTSGNHVWRVKEGIELLKLDPRVLRPANYPDRAPGAGSVVLETLGGVKVGLLNLQGRVFMDPVVDCPFRTAEREVQRLRLSTSIILVDMHGEATSEKVALGWFLDGTVSCIVGTHTHIQTADERILPKGTGFLTDLGMTGPYDSVIGRDTQAILDRFLSGVPGKAEVASSNIQLRGALVEIDRATGKATQIERVALALKESVKDVR
ncbi:MAG: TIGR00282 family metallophosphoesterase [Candidatus Omnitrophica bacterium]|nr:TIGR00282 family metallophosphoesterase [Candidatus Omnitrophota bacterium]